MEERSTHKIYEEGNVGEVRIADDVVAVIASLAAMEVEGVAGMPGNVTADLVAKLGMKNLSKGVHIEMTDEAVSVDLTLVLSYGYSIVSVAGKVQDRVKSAIETMTGLSVNEVNVKVASVELKDK